MNIKANRVSAIEEKFDKAPLETATSSPSSESSSPAMAISSAPHSSTSLSSVVTE